MPSPVRILVVPDGDRARLEQMARDRAHAARQRALRKHSERVQFSTEQARREYQGLGWPVPGIRVVCGGWRPARPSTRWRYPARRGGWRCSDGCPRRACPMRSGACPRYRQHHVRRRVLRFAGVRALRPV